MVDNIMKQKILLEEKYNCYLEEMEDGDMVLKRKLRTKDDDDDHRSLQERILDRLKTELYGAFHSTIMSAHS